MLLSHMGDTPASSAFLPWQLQVLSEDYSKVVFLCADRSVAFHAKFGAYFRTRIPKFGRDLAYHPYNADLLVAGSSNEIYR
jgi:ribosome biogenesis protein ENP2